MSGTQLLDREENNTKLSSQKFYGGNSKGQIWKNNSQKMSNEQGSNNGYRQNKQQKTTCSKCRKEYLDECLHGMGLCFHCEKTGHLMNNWKENSFANSKHKKGPLRHKYIL